MRHPIRKAFTLRYSLETLCVLLTLMGLAAVLHQFVIGKHFIIPTVILVLPLITGNVARFGYRDRPWAKHVAFWIGVVATAHWFFAIFYSKTLKAMLGAAWEPVAIAITLVLAYLTWQYRRRNELDL